MAQREHSYVGVDVRKHCPALKAARAAKTELPGPDNQYSITLFLKEVNLKGTVCPYGVSRSINSNDGFPVLELADAPVRLAPSGRIRATLECGGCRHLAQGFRTRELALKPRTLTGR